ncbi:1-acyl-sn-glycerol-3-phosphate acyltransferase [Spirochaetia bacterium]|nr:1-acyl-sn-glycerol-3-phosphate acyltransferase [Spirochaetia bacterium]
MSLIKTIGAFFILVLVMILHIPLGILVFILSILGFKKPMSHLVYRIAQGVSRLMILLTGCPLTVLGREIIPKTGGLCLVGNHGSIFDIVLLLAYAGRPVGFIAKKELAYVPFLNIWILLLGGLFIDRSSIRKSVATINTGVKRIKAGGAMSIFPEGHRSKGQGLLPFHAGSFKLATQALAPIVPVAIAGSYEVFEKEYRIRAFPVKVTFGKPIITADIPPASRRQVLADMVRNVIAQELEAMETPLSNVSNHGSIQT